MDLRMTLAFIILFQSSLLCFLFSKKMISEMGTIKLASLPNEKKDPVAPTAIDHHTLYKRSTLKHSCLIQNTAVNWCHALPPGLPGSTVTGTRSLMMGAC